MIDNKKIINIMPDDKFLDYFIAMSESFIPDLSKYFIYTNNVKLNYIKSKNKNLNIIKHDNQSLLKILDQLNGDEIIIFHSFSDFHLDFIERLPKSIKKIWIFWGYEGYKTVPNSKLIMSETFKAIYPTSFIYKIKSFFSRIKNFNLLKPTISEKIIKNMDYCATWVEADYLLAKKYNPNIKYIPFNYYTDELMNIFNFKSNFTLNTHNLNSSQISIFLGNSAAPTNNHIEALHYLKKINFKGNIYCSLSYGGSEIYIQNVIKTGKKFFGANFKPLIDFLPLQTYQSILNSCQIVWMNHKRQQAAGNLFMAFANKKIVILNPDNPMLNTFKNWGLHYYKKEILENLNKINKIKIEKNKTIIKQKIKIDYNEFFFKLIQKL